MAAFALNDFEVVIPPAFGQDHFFARVQRMDNRHFIFARRKRIIFCGVQVSTSVRACHAH